MSWQIIGDIHIDFKEELIEEKVDILDSYITCENVIILGDVSHIRKHTSTLAVDLLQKLFEKYQEKTFWLIVGNHDCKFKNTLHPNSIETSFGYMDNVVVVDKPMSVDNFLLIPWICDSNYQDCIDVIKTSKQKYVAGHFAINSFLMTRGIKCISSLKISDFDHFEKVFSGHFHLRQENKNIIYVGSIVQETWTDYLDQKGYYVVDEEIAFVEGSVQIYKHLVLENNKSKFEIDDYKDTHLKIFHYEKLSKKQFDIIDELKKCVRSYQLFDETDEAVKEVVIEKVEFSEVLDEFFGQQEDIEYDFKEDIKEYLIMKHEEIG